MMAKPKTKEKAFVSFSKHATAKDASKGGPKMALPAAKADFVPKGAKKV